MRTSSGCAASSPPGATTRTSPPSSPRPCASGLQRALAARPGAGDARHAALGTDPGRAPRAPRHRPAPRRAPCGRERAARTARHAAPSPRAPAATASTTPTRAPAPPSCARGPPALVYLEVHPVVSVVVVAEHGDLQATLASLDAQVYDRIEVVVVASRRARCAPPSLVVTAAGTFEELAQRRGRGRQRASSCWCCGAGDLLRRPRALSTSSRPLQDGADAAYGDEDRYDVDREHHDGHLKPAPFGTRDPLLLRRRRRAARSCAPTLFQELGGLDATTAPVAAHDLALRLVRGDRVDRPRRRGAARRDPSARRPDPADATAATIPVVAAGARARSGATADGRARARCCPSVRLHASHPPSPAPLGRDRDPDEGPPGPARGLPRLGRAAHHLSQLLDRDLRQRLGRGGDARVAGDCGPRRRAPAPARSTTRAIVNRGVAHTDADFVVTLNNDTTIATPGLARAARRAVLARRRRLGRGQAPVSPTGGSSTRASGSSPCPCTSARDANYASRRPLAHLDARRRGGDRRLPDRPHRGLARARRPRRAAGGRLQRRRLRPAAVRGGLARRLHPRGRARPPRERVAGEPAPDDDVLELVARWDLLGDFVDPSMPAGDPLRRGGRRAGDAGGDALDEPVPGCACREGTEDAAGSGVARAACRRPRLATAVRRLDREARVVLDDDASATRSRPRPPAPPGAATRVVRSRARCAHGAGSARTAPRGPPLPPVLRPRARRRRPRCARGPRRSSFLERHRGRRSSSSPRARRPRRDPRVARRPGLRPHRGRRRGRRDRARATPPSLVVAADGHLRGARQRRGGGRDRRVRAACCVAGDLLAPHAICRPRHRRPGRRATPPTATRTATTRHDEHARRAPQARARSAARPSSPTTSSARRCSCAPTLFKELGGYDATTAPVAAHDLALRLAEATDGDRPRRRACCVSRPEADAPDPADATAATIPRRRPPRSTRVGATARGRARARCCPSVRYTVAPPSPAPSVAIVIPTRDRLDLLEACLDSVERAHHLRQLLDRDLRQRLGRGAGPSRG